MPLTDGSNSKVSLTSLSATTSAAAETIWSKSKKSLKKQPSVDTNGEDCVTTEVESNNHRSNAQGTSHPTSLLPLNQAPLEKHDFRRKFLEGLQFYCENSSLILNSDLPADLVEFVTSQGFSVESLGIILELKKSSSAFSAYVENRPPAGNTVLGVKAATDRQTREQNFSEISRRLLQHWMSADSCAEAFVSLSLGEEIPGLIAECSSFQRMLFAVPDNFNLYGKDFLKFILAQIYLSIFALTYGIQTISEEEVKQISEEELKKSNNNPIKVRTQVIAAVLDRVLVRYFSDVDYFYDQAGEICLRQDVGNPFQNFITDLVTFCKASAIGRRLVSKIFLHLGSHSASKLAKTLFSTISEAAAAATLLYPSSEFLENNASWKFVLSSLPVKTTTKSKRFWLNWAVYIHQEAKQSVTFLQDCVEHWVILNKSPSVDIRALHSATLAIVALAYEIKRNSISVRNQEKPNISVFEGEFRRILESIIHSLESIDEAKRSCGMALGQIVSDMLSSIVSKSKPEESDANPLKFESNSTVFLDLIKFYEIGYQTKELNDPDQVKRNDTNLKHVEVLDSDDEVLVEDSCMQSEKESDGFKTLDDEESSEIPVDSRILTLRSRKQKIPMYFSEIVEALLEGSKNEDEAEILRYVAVLKIPVLLFSGIRIDAKMATTISRCLADMENASSLQIPITFALYELFVTHPFEVTEVIANIVFDRNHYSLGQRLMNLDRLTEVLQISSKQMCFNCFGTLLLNHKNELLGVYPEFINKYYAGRKTLRMCHECRKSSRNVDDKEINCTTVSVPQQSEPIKRTDEALTWRQIVDIRVASKTRYFVTPRSKTVVTVPDQYSSKLLPIVWSCIANRLTSSSSFYLDNVERRRSGKMHDIFLVKVFQYLSRCILGSGGPECPHIRNVASHAGELITHFVQHDDAIVRRTVLSLLGVTLSACEGKIFVIEALSKGGNLLQNVELLLNIEQDEENQRFLKHIQTYVIGCTTSGLLEDINQQMKNSSIK